MALKFLDRVGQVGFYRITTVNGVPTEWRVDFVPAAPGQNLELLGLTKFEHSSYIVPDDRIGLLIDNGYTDSGIDEPGTWGEAAWEVWEARQDIDGGFTCMHPTDPSAHTAFENNQMVRVCVTLSARHLTALAAAAGL